MAETTEVLRSVDSEETCTIIQDKSEFCFGCDAVLLASFARIKSRDNVCDLCSGNGVLPLLLAMKNHDCRITGVELQEHAADMAARSIAASGFSDRVRMVNADINNCFDAVPKNSCTVVTCNPPYEAVSNQKQSPKEAKQLARHEIACTLDDVCRVAGLLLNSTGRFYMVHRPKRLAEICTCLTKYQLEPKRFQFVHPDKDHAATMVLIEAVKCGQSGAIIEPAACIR